MTVPEPVTPAQPQPVVIALTDEIDMANAGRVYQQIAAQFAGGAQVVIADLTGTAFCDTLGTRALVQACHRAARAAVNCGCCPAPRSCKCGKS